MSNLDPNPNAGHDPNWVNKQTKTTYLDHNCQNGCIERAKHKAIEYDRQRCEGAELLETTNFTSSTQKKGSDLQSVVTKDEGSTRFHSLEDDLPGRLYLAPPTTLLDRSGEVGVIEDGLGETELLIKSDGANEERECFCQADRIEGDLEVV